LLIEGDPAFFYGGGKAMSLKRFFFGYVGYVVLFLFFGLLLSAGVGPAEVQGYQLPDTGQTKCYDNDGNLINCPDPGEPFYGQDAQYEGVQPAYQDNGNETVTDLNTGLMWQQDDGYYGTWQDARYYCTNLSLGAYNDWRFPERRELFSILDFGWHEPAINTDFFPECLSGYYWSGTQFNNLFLDRYVWSVSFRGGSVVYKYMDDPIVYIRGVRGKPLPPGAFINNGDGTVTDTVTGLEWQQWGFTKKNWQDALAYCECLTLAGHDDWRLPNIRELESIVDIKRYNLAIDPVFQCGWLPRYWSSSTWEEAPAAAWIVEFVSGVVSPYSKTLFTDICVRCVRGGNELPNLTLSVNKSGTGTGTVTSEPAGIDCGSDCSEAYPEWSIVTLIAEADPGSEFSGWGGDSGQCGTNTVCTLFMDGDKNVSANFDVSDSLPTIYETMSSARQSIYVQGTGGSKKLYTDFGGNDIYTILKTFAGDVEIRDNQATTINLPEGLNISAAMFASNGVQFTINGFTLTLLGTPDLFTFVFAGTPITPTSGVSRTFEETAQAFGTTVPTGGQINPATVTGTIQSDGFFI